MTSHNNEIEQEHWLCNSNSNSNEELESDHWLYNSNNNQSLSTFHLCTLYYYRRAVHATLYTKTTFKLSILHYNVIVSSLQSDHSHLCSHCCCCYWFPHSSFYIHRLVIIVSFLVSLFVKFSHKHTQTHFHFSPHHLLCPTNTHTHTRISLLLFIVYLFIMQSFRFFTF